MSSTLMTMAQFGVEELPEPEFLRYYPSKEAFEEDFNKWCNLVDNIRKRGRKKRKRERRKKEKLNYYVEL